MELMHNFCLVHDDLEDGDKTRRGRASVWARFGQAHAINVGDYLLVQAHRAILEWGRNRLDAHASLRLLALLEETLERTHVGQALDMNARARRDLGLEDYMRLARYKTGYYLAAPIQGGAIVAGAEAPVMDSIGRMAEFLGPLFQIMDDLIDLTEGKGREGRGSDIREGKRSFMAVWTAGRCSEADRSMLFEILDKPREATTEKDIASAIRLFERTGALEAARSECKRLHEQSLPILETLPERLSGALAPVFESLTRRVR
jgi:geranylgeranyl diphosphate synthase type I